MGDLYVRHELLRHESIRLFTLIAAKISNKDFIASSGFYYCEENSSLLCFSCNLSIQESTESPFSLHLRLSPDCNFLNGSDVSISQNKSLLLILGSPQIINRDWLYKNYEKKYCERVFSKYNFKKPWRKYNKDCTSSLISIYAPMKIPSINRAAIFDVEDFFIYMRSEEKRLETFKLKMFPYPLSETFFKILAFEGFFYCLVDKNTQCAYCRYVIGGWSENMDIKYTHSVLSPKCKFVRGERVENIQLNEPNLYIKSSNEQEVQEVDFQEYNMLKDRLKCKICFNNDIDIIFDYCGHAISCSNCSKCLKCCPTCRGSILAQKKIYFS